MNDLLTDLNLDKQQLSKQNLKSDIIVFCNTNKSKNTEKYGVYSLKHINPLHPHSAYTSHSRFNPCSTDQPSQPCIPQYQ